MLEEADDVKRGSETIGLTNHIILCFLATVPCEAPLVLTQDGQCINILLDFNNCGSVGFVCGSEFTSCSAGVCSTAPAVQLANPRIIWLSAINGYTDDAMFVVSLPFSITLYGVTVSRVTVTTNGVSDAAKISHSKYSSSVIHRSDIRCDSRDWYNFHIQCYIR